jgi:hypothetical protein
VCEGEVPLQEFSFALRSLKAVRKTQRVIYHVATNETWRGNVTALFASSKDDDHITADVFVPDETLLSKWSEAGHFLYRRAWRTKVAKLYMFQLLPHVKRCIMLDTDIMFGRDVSELWSEFERFEPKDVIAATWRPELVPGNKINAGVMLMDFEKMRQPAFANRYQETPAYSVAIGRPVTRLGLVDPYCPEQETLEGVLDDNRKHDQNGLIQQPRSLRALDVTWNLEMCRDFYDRCFGLHPKMVPFGIIHGNCAESSEDNQNNDHFNRPVRTWWMSAYFKQYVSCFNFTSLLQGATEKASI